ncbi:RICIN domain-containing protein [Fulvivirga sediminis]|uniref:RICIN domain-containing protein n=1 Tax=Fulvivirga sediminis TaxID=2803949 RepID=A0A937F4X7_9BACT|nr:RICIN domain-containing protein [Fulvivirga sediminis]MBL3655835.1 RICIN domain-containing protein [Fulvivirga sediminis]
MKIKTIIRFGVILLLMAVLQAHAQTSSSDYLEAQPIPDRTLYYSVSDAGENKPITWGLDLAWLSEGNIRRGIAFMGKDRVDVVRSSFTPTSPLINGDLAPEEMDILNQRLNIIDLLSPSTQVVLNSDHPRVDAWFQGNASHWAQLIDVTTAHHQNRGRTVITVSPFNEPDYSATGQGTIEDFYNVAGELRQNYPRFDQIRISGGNTLNADQALPWYNFLNDRLDEGNTHQLAGSFDSYANFFQTVRANGHHATNDELHNVMEAMVGVEYGMQTGIWWGTAELARGEFVKASDGKRLAYAEHRPNWTAASVYKAPDGKIQAFGGTSERQAATTTYSFVSKDRDVYYDGYGPQREYTMVMPGGNGYQQGQTNAERVVNITWGDDIQPAINGQYILVNKASGQVMEVAGGSTEAGANLQQGSYSGNAYQKWNVTPVDSRIGGDFSYFTITALHSGKSPDILNWSLDNGADIIVWDNTKGGNQQWYLDYAGDGWFYIRSRHSAQCITTDGSNIVQWEPTNSENQQWRLLPLDAAVEFSAPSKPQNLKAKANAASIKLDWTANIVQDLRGYNIYRAESNNGPYNTIGRNVTANSFVDNTTRKNVNYFYKIKATDKSLNSSIYSNTVSATISNAEEMIAHYSFDANTRDHTVNLNHAAAFSNTPFVEGKKSQAISLNGSNTFLQLPSTLPHHEEISIATWVYWKGGNAWQRIFDFGNSEQENMFLTPSSGSGQLRFGIKNGGEEQTLSADALPVNQWSHVVITLSEAGASMYVNGLLVDESSSISITPLDFKPVRNYIGRSQYPDPLFNGLIDDFRVYNYEISVNEINNLNSAQSNVNLPDTSDEVTTRIDEVTDNKVNISPNPTSDFLNIHMSSDIKEIDVSVSDLSGKKILNTQSIESTHSLNLTGLEPGMYIIRIKSKGEVIKTERIIKN